MEIIIGLVILGGVAWFFFMRDGKKSDEVAPAEPNNVTAPYKVPEPAATTPIPLVVEVLPAGTEASSIVAPATKAKAPAKPRAAVKPKAPAKTAAKAPAKAPAKTAKAKTPAKPKVSVAK
jgi:hypothetical protein